MADLTELNNALANPNVRKMLDLISYTEGTQRHGYHTLVGGTRFDDLNRHPNKVGLRTKDGASTAAGRYQITGSTWRGLQRQYGFSDFSPQSQDLAAVALLKRRGALNHVLQGDFNQAINKLGQEWVSLPSSTNRNQGHRSWADVSRFLGQQASGSTTAGALAGGIAGATGAAANIGAGNGAAVASGASAPLGAVGSNDVRVAPVGLDSPSVAVEDGAAQLLPSVAQQDDVMQTAAREQAFNQQMENWRIKPLVFDDEAQSNSNPYAAQLAQAFGEYPDMKQHIPNELDLLIQSIYDEV